jgi:hypothetical protein
LKINIKIPPAKLERLLRKAKPVAKPAAPKMPSNAAICAAKLWRIAKTRAIYNTKRIKIDKKLFRDVSIPALINRFFTPFSRGSQ